MAAAEMLGVEKMLEQMEVQQALLGTCASLWRTLAAHLAAVDESLRIKSQALTTAADSLDSRSHQSLASLLARESALPARESAAAAHVVALRDAALADLRSAPDGGAAPPVDSPGLIRLHCRRMDARSLWRLVAARRRDAVVEATVAAAVAEEAVDPARLVLDAVEDLVAGVGASDDQRWAVGVLLRAAFFPAADSEAAGAAEPGWSVAERAAAVAEKWRERMGEKESKLGPLEGIMFLQFVSEFRLGSRLDDQLLKDLVIRFAAEKDSAKLALALFKDKLTDMIRELIKDEKEIEAVFLVCGSGLVGEFPPIPLLKNSLKNLKTKSQNILKNGGFSKAAAEESRILELNYVKSIIKCVEENKLEGEYDLHILRKRQMHLGKPNLDKKDGFSKPSKKRGRDRSRGGRPGYPPAKGKKPPPRHWDVQERPNPSAGYGGPYGYPSQAVYGTPPSGLRDSPHGEVHGQNPAAFPLRQYPREASGTGMSAAYNGPAGYGGSDYGAPHATSNYELSYQL